MQPGRLGAAEPTRDASSDPDVVASPVELACGHDGDMDGSSHASDMMPCI